MLWQAAEPITWTSQAAEPVTCFDKRQSRAAQDLVMSKKSLVLVLQNKQENSAIDMVKLQVKSEKLTPFGG